MAALWREKLAATVDSAPSLVGAVHRIQHHKYDIILVNRILAADSSSGLTVVGESLKKTSVPVMLVSDIAEAQEIAVSLEGERGFGKAQLAEPSTLELVLRVASA